MPLPVSFANPGQALRARNIGFSIGCRLPVPADALVSQFRKASPSHVRLFPGDGAQPPPDPRIKRAQRRRGLAEAEVMRATP